MTKKVVTGRSSPAVAPARQRAVVLEFDHLVVHVRELTHAAMTRVLGRHQVPLTPGLFLRLCAGLHRAEALADIRFPGGRVTSLPALMAEMETEVARRMVTPEPTPDALTVKLVKTLNEKSVKVGVLTSLEAGIVGPALQAMGLNETRTSIVTVSAEELYMPSAESWGKFPPLLAVAPSVCTAIATSAESCRAALAARMRCVAVPDKHTAFQDFSGADGVIEGTGRAALTELFETLGLT